MSYEKRILEVKEAVEEAIRLIRAKHVGANLDEARRLLSDAGAALKKDRFEEATALAKKAQLAARPTTEYLLSKAREFASGAERSSSSKNYGEAVDLWKKALEEYARAGELAKERNEREIVDGLSEVGSRIKENISKAEIALDNRKMVSLVDEGNKMIGEANKLFEAKSFDESRDAYEKAKKAFESALEFAAKRNFVDDSERIREALKSIEASIEAVPLNKGDAMLLAAEERYKEKKFTDAEEAYSSALKYLEDLKVSRKKELEEMLERGREGLVRTKIELGKENMRRADNLFKDKKYYDTKEAYKAARDYFEKVMDAASGYKLSKLVEELNNLTQACSQNMTAATTALMGVGGVEPEIVPVGDVGKGVASFRPAIRQPVPPTVGKLRDKYDDLVYLGGGGFADVYRAKRRKDGTVVAVKVPRNLDERTEEIFFRELSIWEDLKHRNIARLIKPYLKPEPHLEIEYVDGPSLYEALKSKPFSVEEACRIAFDIASGLEYAHNMHRIHGDITPKNVLLTSFGEAKITDFGLAKIATSSSEGRGYTLPFAPVEMFEKRIVNEKTDVYQLGLAFYCMLTGYNPFDTGSRYETEERIKSHTPQLPSKCNPEIGDLDGLIMRCLSKNPGERPSTREFRETLYEFVKKNYHDSLPLTEDTPRILTMSCRYAMMAAKCGDIAECIGALNYARGKVRDPDTRNKMQNLIEMAEFRSKNEMPLEPLLDEMETVLKKVEWEG